MRQDRGSISYRILLLLLPLCVWLAGCSRSVDPLPDMPESHCTRLLVDGLDITTTSDMREESIESLNRSLRSWAFGRDAIPTIAWDVDGQKVIAEVQGYSCDRAADLIGEIVDREVRPGTYECEACAWIEKDAPVEE